MIELSFAGWFQCRLATDPDPYDEPRGVSGYVHAYAGEPDLDRIVSFKPPPFRRTHGRDIGVAVDAVAHEGIAWRRGAAKALEPAEQRAEPIAGDGVANPER